MIGVGVVGAQERTRTSTTLRPLAPEASASASSATWAQVRQLQQSLIFSADSPLVNESAVFFECSGGFRPLPRCSAGL